MPASHVSAIDSTVCKTHQWLGDLAAEGGFYDQAEAYTALRAVLHGLRDRLTLDAVVDLGAQLPLLVRGLYYEGWTPTGKPQPIRSRQEFLAGVESRLGRASMDPVEAIRAVFTLLKHRISAGEIENVRAMLPHSIRAFWPMES